MLTGFQTEANEWEAINKFKLWEDFQSRQTKAQAKLKARKALADELLKQHEALQATQQKLKQEMLDFAHKLNQKDAELALKDQEKLQSEKAKLLQLNADRLKITQASFLSGEAAREAQQKQAEIEVQQMREQLEAERKQDEQRKTF